jgi:ABC-2 type transport system permease protein
MTHAASNQASLDGERRRSVSAVALPAQQGGVSLATQVAVLAQRSIKRTIRQPAQIVPSLVFPLFMLAVNASGLKSATRIPGFPTSSYITFALAVPFMQGALFAVINAGTDVAADIETGFLNRLQLTPTRGFALLAGELAGVVAFGQLTTLFYIVVGLIAGAHIEAGVPGVLVLMALALVISLGFGALGALAAIRTGSGEAVQGLFPVFFVALFLSSMYLPRDLIKAGWFHTVADWNPVSYLLEGIRSVLITGWDGTALGRAFAIAAAIALLSLAGASVALRKRMGRS